MLIAAPPRRKPGDMEFLFESMEYLAIEGKTGIIYGMRLMRMHVSSSDAKDRQEFAKKRKGMILSSI